MCRIKSTILRGVDASNKFLYARERSARITQIIGTKKKTMGPGTTHISRMCVTILAVIGTLFCASKCSSKSTGSPVCAEVQSTETASIGARFYGRVFERFRAMCDRKNANATPAFDGRSPLPSSPKPLQLQYALTHVQHSSPSAVAAAAAATGAAVKRAREKFALIPNAGVHRYTTTTTQMWGIPTRVRLNNAAPMLLSQHD